MRKTTQEYEKFEKTMQEIIKVPHSEIKAKLDQEKKNRIEKKKKKDKK